MTLLEVVQELQSAQDLYSDAFERLCRAKEAGLLPLEDPDFKSMMHACACAAEAQAKIFRFLQGWQH